MHPQVVVVASVLVLLVAVEAVPDRIHMNQPLRLQFQVEEVNNVFIEFCFRIFDEMFLKS